MATYSPGSLTGNALSVGIALVLHDRFSNQAREASKEMRKLHREAKAVVEANLQTAQGLLSGAFDFGMAVANGMKDAVLVGTEYIDTMTTVQAITEASDKTMASLENTAANLNRETMLSAGEIASAMKYLAMAGNSAEEVNEMISGVAMVAGATGLKIGGKGGAADMITNVMKVFRMEGKGASSLVGDMLTKATLSANMSMEDLAESIRYAASDLQTLNMDLPQTAALIGTLGNAGLQGSIAGTALSNMARYFVKSITNPEFQGGKVLASLGLSKSDFVDAKGDLKDFGDAFVILGERMQNLTSVDKLGVINALFGVRGLRGAKAILNDIEGYKNLLDQVRNSEGYAASIMAKRMETLAGRVEVLRSNWENLMISFTKALEPTLKPLVSGLANIVDFLGDLFRTPVIGPLVATLLAAGTAVTIVVSGVGKLVVGFRMLTTDSLVRFKTMFHIIAVGWKKATLSAQQYAAMQAAINGQAASGLFGAQVGAMRTGTIVNGIGFNPKANRFTQNGRFISNAKAVQALGKDGAKNLVEGIMGKGKLSGSLATALGGAAVGSSLGKLASIGGKLLRFLGGPWGAALMAVSLVLPMLSSNTKLNADEVRDNTGALKKNTDELKKTREEDKAIEQIRNQQLMIALTNAFRDWASIMKNQGDKPIELKIDNNTGLPLQVTPVGKNKTPLNTGTK